MTVPGEGVTVAQARETEGPALCRLMQLYYYDFSEFSEMSLNDDGTYGDPELIEEQFAPKYTSYVIRVEGALAGFAIVSPRSYLTRDAGVTDMMEFFVMRAYRRGRIGEFASTFLFDVYPGPWEVRVIAENSAAKSFWRAVIDRYTGGAFIESQLDTDRHRGTLYTFSSNST